MGALSAHANPRIGRVGSVVLRDSFRLAGSQVESRCSLDKSGHSCQELGLGSSWTTSCKYSLNSSTWSQTDLCCTSFHTMDVPSLYAGVLRACSPQPALLGHVHVGAAEVSLFWSLPELNTGCTTHPWSSPSYFCAMGSPVCLTTTWKRVSGRACG